MTAAPALADYYAQRAAEYERIYQKPERQSELHQLKRLVRAAMAQRNVLEIACGTGYWTEAAAESATSIAAFDINEAVLEIARSKPVDPDKVTFAIGDAYQLPVAPDRFNAALSVFWWSHVPLEKLDSFMHSVNAAVAPGALIAFLDNRYVEGSSTPVSRRDAEGNDYQLRKLDDGSTHEVLKNFPAESELIQRASRHGWGAHVELLEHYWLLTYWAPR